MAYNTKLAERIRDYLSAKEGLKMEERKMFGGLAFLIDGKMCINVGEDRLMCRFDPELTEVLTNRTGFVPMIMNNREYKGYCYVDPIGYTKKEDFEFWMTLCLDFNSKAKSSKKRKKK